MIRHLVLFKLNEGVSREEPRVRAGAAGFKALGSAIPEVESWECGWNISDRPIAFDFAITSSMADENALKRYLDHPEHRALAAQWQEFASLVIADYLI